MKNLLAILILIILTSCSEAAKKVQEEEADSDSNMGNLRLGPIIHESLSEEQIEKIKFIQETFEEVYPVSLDETITNFKRDKNPDSEIKVWLSMANTFQTFALKSSGEGMLERRKEAFKLILMRSMMSEKEAISSSELKLLDKNEIQEILNNYTLDAKPIQVESK